MQDKSNIQTLRILAMSPADTETDKDKHIGSI